MQGQGGVIVNLTSSYFGSMIKMFVPVFLVKLILCLKDLHFQLKYNSVHFF